MGVEASELLEDARQRLPKRAEARVRLLVARLQRVEHLAGAGVDVTVVVGECGCERVLHGASETRVLRLVRDELALELVALVDERAQSGLLVCARV